MLVRKILVNKDIMRMMSTSIKGRHSIDAEINAELLQYSYLLWTKTVFLV